MVERAVGLVVWERSQRGAALMFPPDFLGRQRHPWSSPHDRRSGERVPETFISAMGASRSTWVVVSPEWIRRSSAYGTHARRRRLDSLTTDAENFERARDRCGEAWAEAAGMSDLVVRLSPATVASERAPVLPLEAAARLDVRLPGTR